MKNTALKEQIRQRDKAIRDYENDMAIAKSEGRKEERNMIAETMRNRELDKTGD